MPEKTHPTMPWKSEHKCGDNDYDDVLYITYYTFCYGRKVPFILLKGKPVETTI